MTRWEGLQFSIVQCSTQTGHTEGVVRCRAVSRTEEGVFLWSAGSLSSFWGETAPDQPVYYTPANGTATIVAILGGPNRGYCSSRAVCVVVSPGWRQFTIAEQKFKFSGCELLNSTARRISSQSAIKSDCLRGQVWRK